MARKIRLSDIAAQAGVSTATVSRVLNGKDSVAADTRQAVIAALDLLGYERPEKLRERSGGQIGIIVPELTNPVFLFHAAHRHPMTLHGYTPSGYADGRWRHRRFLSGRHDSATGFRFCFYFGVAC